MLDHFSSSSALQPGMNLQDLYIWVTIVGVPNAIMDNRRFLLPLYLHKPSAPKRVTLRYENQGPRDMYVSLAAEAQIQVFVPNHSLFRDYPTPNGARFMQCLDSPIHVPDGCKVPGQKGHRESVLDGYLDEDEFVARKVEKRALVERTVRGLRLYWEIRRSNRKWLKLQDDGRKGLERALGAGEA